MDNKYITVAYQLYADIDGESQKIEETPEGQPFWFICGMGMTLPMFEDALKDLKTGDTFDFTIPKDDAYGDYDEEHVVDLDKSIFMPDGKLDEKLIYVGAIIPLMNEDGNRFNGSIVSPQNNSIPANVAQALYNQSDHLPVIVDFAIDATVGIAERTDDFLYKVVNPVRDNLDIYLHGIQPDQYTIEIRSIDGKCLATYKETLSEGGQRLSYPFPFKSGMYLLRLSNSKHQEQISKLVK